LIQPGRDEVLIWMVEWMRVGWEGRVQENEPNSTVRGGLI